jgi:spore coat protein, CotS family
MQIPDKKIINKYGLDTNNITPFREGFLVSTTDNRYFLRKLDTNINRLQYIIKAKEYIESNGYTEMDKYMLSEDGTPYALFNDTLYVMTTIPDGRECNLLDRSDIRKASAGLAGLHKASVGFNGGLGVESRCELYKIPMYFTKRLEELKKLKKLAKKGKKEFDNVFLEYSDSFIASAENAIELLDKSEYIELCRKTEGDGTICHHDYTHSNIIVTDEKASITNFDFMCPELRVYDLANFLRRKLRKCNWNFSEGKFIIDEYMSVQSLSVEELRVMGIILMFPQKMWRVCNKYYNSKRSFYEKGYLWQLKEVIEEREPSKAFIKSFEKEYCGY